MTDFYSASGNPDWNVRAGEGQDAVTETVCSVTGLTTQGLVAVGANAAGGEAGTFNGTFSVHVGHRSGALSTGGYCQVGVGLQTLLSSTAAYSTALGTDALKFHQTGNEQTAIGAKAMLRDVTGQYSTVVGCSAAYEATKVERQTIIGAWAAQNPPLGDGNECNVYIGHRAAKDRTGGSYNVEIGHDAGNAASRVDYCTHIGRGSGRYTPNNAYLAGAIGHDASASGSNRFRIGGPGVVPEAGAALQVISDKRDKIHSGDVSLEKAAEIVLGARFVEYVMNPRENYDGYWGGELEALEAHQKGEKKGKRTHAGIYAQDEYSRLSDAGIDFAGLQHAEVKGGHDAWSADYAAYIPYMAVIIQDQQKRIADLEAKLEKLSAAVEKLTG